MREYTDPKQGITVSAPDELTCAEINEGLRGLIRENELLWAERKSTGGAATRPPIEVALEELFRVTRLEFGFETPKGMRIMKVAKAICRLRGKDAEAIVTGHPGIPCMAGNGAIAITYPIQPAWATYWDEAAAAIEAVDGK